MKKYSLGVAALLGLFLLNDASASRYEDIFRALRDNPEVRQLAKKAIKDARAFVSANPAERATSELERLRNSDKARREVDKASKNIEKALGLPSAFRSPEENALIEFKQDLMNEQNLVIDGYYGDSFKSGSSRFFSEELRLFKEALDRKLSNIETITISVYDTLYGSFVADKLLNALQNGRLQNLNKITIRGQFYIGASAAQLVEAAKIMHARVSYNRPVLEFEGVPIVNYEKDALQRHLDGYPHRSIIRIVN